MNKKRWISIFIPVVILLGMTVFPLITIVSGEEIILQTRPVDPRDIFRGDYVVLNYEIEEIDIDKVEEALVEKIKTSYFPQNNKLYVILKEEKGVHIVDKVVEKEPASSTTYIEGEYIYFRNKNERADEDAKLIMSYNIDKYFVGENTGVELENAAREGELMAKVKVLKGYAILREVYIK